MAPTDLIDDLLRSARELHLLPLAERECLVERAASEVAELRERLEARKPAKLPLGFVSDLQALRQHGETGSDVLMGTVLIAFAEEIRRLRLLDWEAEQA
ncbi:hypothetical protein [Pseudorhizobium flavum]|uniref:Uncharacterized protein n=1 Tax=Pseudorhizobium flavum TaxID=1335061 RepID=A0A7W9YZM7_9HYPH|nr:hypothetical protein [Pseudorhizobium flavum]MBB6179996.1 hypothetical protein [Pseudorhizobium flavum]CAD6598809.1 hypothetical protein RFYW14_00616 [Pseudorhizobium flavum]